MIRRYFRMVAVAGIGLSASFSLPPNLHAAWPVFDAANFSRNTVTSVQMVQDVLHQVTQIQNQIRQYEATLQTLQSLDASTWQQVQSLLRAQTGEFNELFYNLDAIGYNLSQIDTQFNTLFPERTDWEDIDTADFEQYYRDWNEELNESAKTAMKAQASIARVQDYNDEVQAILSRSGGAQGEVRQMQAQNQMLSVMNNQLGDLTGTIAASGRITATMAAKTAAREEAERELNRRAGNGWGGERTDRQPPRSMP